MSRKIFYTLFFLSPAITIAQLLPFKTYSVKDGLLHKEINSVTSDELGLLWIGTPFGINWFDGNRFSEPLIKNIRGQLFVTNFFKDSQKNIWVLTFYNGLYKYENFNFKNFLPDQNIEANANNVLDMVEVEKNKYLVATDQNIYWFDGSSFSLFDIKNPGLAIQFNSIGLVRDRWLFFGSSFGIYCYKKNNGQWQFAGKSLPGHGLSKIIIEKEHAWFATDKGLLYFENADDVLPGNPSQIFFKNQLVISVTKNEKSGEWWVSSDKLYKLANGKIRPFDSSNGLPAPPGQIYFDRENNGWICSGNGLTRMGDENYLFYDLLPGPSHSMINMIAQDEKNSLWLATYNGFGQKTETGIKAFHSAANKKIGYVSWMHKTKQNILLAGTELGIVSIKNNQVNLINKLQTTKAFEDDEGNLWLATLNGRVYKMTGIIIREISVKPAHGDFIDAIYKDKQGVLWLGYRGTGVRKFKIEEGALKLVKEYSAKTGINDIRIRCSAVDKKGNILFGTRTNGLFVISLSDSNKIWHFTTSNGLAANWVRSIAEDNNGNIYLATNKGISILAGSYDQTFIRRLNLLNQELSESATTIFPDKEKIWIGTEQGLIEYFPEVEKQKSANPAVFITEFSINGKIDSTMAPYVSSAQKKLESGDKIIAIEFTGIHLSDDVPLQYRYKLVGQDKEWINSGKRNFVTYNLPPGNYTFKAQAQNSLGIWSDHSAELSFIIPAPFWRTWWFISGLALVAGVLFFLIYRYRLKQALKLERLRSGISRDLHDDIGSTLSSISILSDIAVRENDQQQSANMIMEIKHSSVSLMEKMDDIVWSINPSNDSIEDLMLRIKRFASKLLEAKEIDYSINIDDNIHKAKLDMETRQHIYLIMKEAINNLVKYSDCSKAFIEIKYEVPFLDIRIGDNGKGFVQQNIQFGNGIISMKKRAEAIKAQINISTELNKGTMVSLQTKIK